MYLCLRITHIELAHQQVKFHENKTIAALLKEIATEVLKSSEILNKKLIISSYLGSVFNVLNLK